MSGSIWDMILEVEQGALPDLDKPEAAGGGEDVGRAGRDDRVAQLEARLDWTLMVCEAMWSLLKEHLQLTDDRLIERITELDMADGKLDGKKARPPATCGTCSRTVSQRFPRCIYCGAVIERDVFA